MAGNGGWTGIACVADNAAEIQALEADRGRYIGYVRVVGRRNGATPLGEHTLSVRTGASAGDPCYGAETVKQPPTDGYT